jgi:hypothetical protein
VGRLSDDETESVGAINGSAKGQEPVKCDSREERKREKTRGGKKEK